jgi:hypothetical protein
VILPGEALTIVNIDRQAHALRAKAPGMVRGTPAGPDLGEDDFEGGPFRQGGSAARSRRGLEGPPTRGRAGKAVDPVMNARHGVLEKGACCSLTRSWNAGGKARNGRGPAAPLRLKRRCRPL